MKNVLRVGVICSSLFAILVSGCGDSTGGKAVKTAPVSGTVTFNGSAVSGAQVRFLPDNGPMAAATADASGMFTLKSGCAVGPCKVTVSLPEDEESSSTSSALNSNPKTPEEMEANSKKMAEMTTAYQKQSTGKSKSLIPSRYSNPKTSGLDRDIPAAGDKDMKLELKD